MKEERDSKRQKMCSQSEDAIQHRDMISDLPGAILVQILSFLPMEDAVKTGNLSKRWDHLWTKVRSLYFNGPLTRKRTGQEKFISIVNHTLSLVDCDKIEEFSLDFNRSPPEIISDEQETGTGIIDLDVDQWIRCAVRRKVEVLHLNFSYNPSDGPPIGVPYKLPCHVFSNDSIEELMLCFCSIYSNRPIQWNNLKSLFLYNIQLTDVLIQNILSGSPLLAILRLSECNGVGILNVTSPNLKSLALCLKSEPCLELSAPFVETLEISGDIEKYRVMNVSSLLDVQVNPEGQTIHDKFQTMLQGLLQSVRHAKVIALSTRCLQVVSVLEIKMPPTSSFGCNLLELKTSLTKWQLPGLKQLLRTSLNLETLIIRMDDKPCKLSLDKDLLPKYDFDEVNYWSSMLSFPCLKRTLKTVKIFDFSGGSSEIALVEFLLKKSLVLQKMIIYNSRAEYVSQHSAFTSNDMVKFSKELLSIKRALQKIESLQRASQKLLSFQRASPDAVVLFS